MSESTLQYRIFECKDSYHTYTAVMRPSYLYDGSFCASKTESLCQKALRRSSDRVPGFSLHKMPFISLLEWYITADNVIFIARSPCECFIIIVVSPVENIPVKNKAI